MDVVQSKILANRCEPEFLHGLGWLGPEQGQTEADGYPGLIPFLWTGY